MRYKIDVLKTDIKKGKRGSCEKCPVVRAMCRTLSQKIENFESVSVHGPLMFVNTADAAAKKAYLVYVSKQAAQFISKFDKGKPVKPFSFYLTINN